MVGALGVAVLAAEADLASSLMQVGHGPAMGDAPAAFLFANNMVFAKDREKLMGSLESREQFEKFILSGQWMGKDSFAGEVAKEALDSVFDPLGIAEETLKREKKAEAKAEEAANGRRDHGRRQRRKRRSRKRTPRLRRTLASSEAPEKVQRRRRRQWPGAAARGVPSPTRGEKSVSWSNFFGGKREKTQTAERDTEAGGQLNDVVAIPRNARPGDDEMEGRVHGVRRADAETAAAGVHAARRGAGAGGGAEAEAERRRRRKKSASKTEPAKPRKLARNLARNLLGGLASGKGRVFFPEPPRGRVELRDDEAVRP